MNLNNKTILLVEDDKFAKILNKKVLEKAGYNLIIIGSNDDIIEFINKTIINLILIDIELSNGLDGTEIAQKILEKHDIPIVFLSSQTGIEIFEKINKITSYGYIVKNTEDSVLLTSINIAFNLHKAHTELKEKENKLQKAEAILQAAFDQSQAGIAIADLPDGKLRYVNKAGLLIRGEDADNLVKDIDINKYVSSWQTFDFDGRPLNYDEVPLARAILYGETCSRQFIVRRSNNEDRFVFANAAPIKNPQNEQIAAIVVFLDITDLKQAELKIHQSELELKQAQKVAHIGSWSWFIKSNTLKWSDEMYKIFGIDKDSFTGKLTDVISSAIHPEDRKKVEDSNNSVQFEKTPVPLEYRIIHPDKSVRTVWAEAGELILDEKGNPSILTGIVQDITERKKREEDIKKLNEELKARAKELESFSYTVSHDLKTPLTIIQGFSKILLDEYFDKFDNEGKTFIKHIYDTSQQMEQRISDILKFSKATTEDINRTNINLSTLVNLIAIDLKKIRQERNVEFRIQQNIIANADEQLISIALENLILNAWKYTSKLDKAIIEFGLINDGEERIYFVKDNGIGFDMKDADNLFIPFKRLHSSNEFEGSGIGLATVQRIIQKHGGKIWAESKIKEGATFYFTI